MYRADARPAERRRRHRGDDRPFRPRDDAERPLALGRCERDLARRAVRRRATPGPARRRPPAIARPSSMRKPFTIRPKSSRPWSRRRDRHGNLGADELRLPQQRLLAADLLRRDARAVGKLELDRLPVVGNDDLELDEVGAFVRRRVHDREGTTRYLRGDARDGTLARARARSARPPRSARGPGPTPRLRSSRRSSRGRSSGTCASTPARGTARASRLRREPAAARRSARASVPRARTPPSGRSGRRRPRQEVRARAGAHLAAPVRQPSGAASAR